MAELRHDVETHDPPEGLNRLRPAVDLDMGLHVALGERRHRRPRRGRGGSVLLCSALWSGLSPPLTPPVDQHNRVACQTLPRVIRHRFGWGSFGLHWDLASRAYPDRSD